VRRVRGAAFVLIFAFACSGNRDRPHESSAKGLEVTYSLDLDAALDDRASEVRRDFEQLLADEKLTGTVTVTLDRTITVAVEDPAQRAPVETKLHAEGATLERVPCAADVGDRGVCARIAAPYAATVRKAALAEAVVTIGARLHELAIDDVDVRADGENIVLALPTIDQERLAKVKRVIARGGRLAFFVVEENAPYMQKLYRYLAPDRAGKATEPAAHDAEIEVELDAWSGEDGARHPDVYLRAYDRETLVAPDEAKRLGCLPGITQGDKVVCRMSGRAVIERYLHDLAQRDPSFALPPDRRIGYEIMRPRQGARDSRPYAHTYLLESIPRLTGRAIANARVSSDPTSNRPVVLLDFNREGARTFGELTAEITAKKLAIVLDGSITSAPVINGPIRDGRASITMGGSDAERMEEDARELAMVLRAGSLPAPLREERERMR
jgi:protein-export membrane protein SecD